MSKKSYWMIIVAAILCLALAATGCGPGEPNGNGEATELKVGMVGPLTGGAASYGVSIKNGVEIAIDEANETGELGDITLKLFAEDTTGDWSQAANAFSKLIEVDKVNVIVGAVLSSETAAGGPIAMDAGIPTISPSSTAVDLTKGNPYLFRNCL
ncbi:MAG TPA: ABC transporter substrate-binding protein, partial [Firmicutes bacterium]|nr:ABC transporter substrate-binding protein [Bacillota bacterium]